MNINAMTNYELIQQKELKDLKSEGYLLRHKKSGARVLLMEMMMKIRCLRLDFALLRRTVQDFRIFWSIRCCADRKIFR